MAPITATEFLDTYEHMLRDSAHTAAATRRGVPLGKLIHRESHFYEVRKQLRERGITDDEILERIREIMAFIVAHLGDLATILALILPLFVKPMPASASVAESVYGTDV